MSIAISSLTPSTIAETSAAKVVSLPMQGRLSLRARDGLDKLGAALGLSLPQKIGQCARADGIEAVCLGPDEWTLLLPLDQVATVTEALAALMPELPHALTDISGREVTFRIEGTRAAELLTIGCARDLSGVAPGEARRTLFDVATVVLWHDGENAFRMDVWNSFAPFIAQTLEVGCKELAAEAA
ncbi:sarcosine oxidase subunit gamma [Celeribacter neptunius]|uniref:Sarcosine oxidase subunit gamma n=1 Tax=Celeribacter neptunius TaxID=588602 RepID=A0A1I3UEU9_9RHOB|nr:sarcosine oxidase subunit gamma family protein [Celeribacter neptunius]SFJ81169.1 sarcosine oxidase subunit gamma [Celeribacter neptunius]